MASATAPTRPFISFPLEDIHQTVHARFEHIALNCADRPAVEWHSEMLTYAALNHAANRLARAILQRSTDERPVAILLEPEAAAVVAILAALKAGRIYVPLDPHVPAERTAFMLADSGASLILTDARRFPQIVASISPSTTTAVLDVWEVDTTLDDPNLGRYADPDSAALIQYTSGSTGRPKGVVQTHRTMLHAMRNLINGFRLDASDRLPLSASLSYASAWTDIFSSLLSGACVLPFNLKEEDVRRFPTWLRERRITVLRTLPSIFRRMGDALAADDILPDVRIVRLGGEPVQRRDVQIYQSHFSPECLFVNRLGSSELTGICHFVMDKSTPLPESLVPAGYPLEDVEVLLLAAGDIERPVAYGEVGEIVIRSRYVSPGYWRSLVGTEGVITEDLGEPGVRLYRTGDLGRLLPDGALVCLGRKDFQVKIRGHRIEVAEIELALLALASITEAVVIAREDRFGQQQLVAYVVTDRVLPSSAELRRQLRQRLPEYMLPARFVPLPSLPRVPGADKVDRRALSAIEEEVLLSPHREPASLETSPAGSAIVDALVTIWSSALKLESVGIDDDFFDLGGDSLLCVQVLLEIEERFGKRLPASLFLEASTIAAQAPVIQNAAPELHWSSLVPIRRTGSRPPLFLIAPLGSEVLYFNPLAAHLGESQPVYGLRVRGLDGWLEPDETIKTIAAHFVEEIRRVQPCGPYSVAGHSSGAPAAYEVAQQLRAAGDEVAPLAILDQPAPDAQVDYRRPVRSFTYPLRFLWNAAFYVPHWASALRRVRVHELTSLIKIRVARVAGGVQRLAHTWGPGPWSVAPLTQAEYFSRVGVPHGLRDHERRVFEAALRALGTYRPQPYGGRLTLIRARRQRLLCSHDPRMGWGHLVRGDVDVHVVPGFHRSMLEEPNVRRLAHVLSACLAAVSGAASLARSLGQYPLRAREDEEDRCQHDQ